MTPARAAAASARTLRALLTGVALAALAGCASVPTGAAPSPQDPWEGFNRKVFDFNEAVDEAVLKPVATAYRDVVPELVRSGVGNVLGNIGDLWSAANHLLQGKLVGGLDMGMRVLTNTLFGLGGLLDPASEMGLKRQSEDFGQTLGRWGLGPGPYLVLPLLGPSNLRDGSALVVDRQASPSRLGETDAAMYGITLLEVVHARAGLLDAARLLDEVSLDKYTFLRQAYLSRRRDLVYDGAPPLEALDLGDDPGDSPPVTSPPKRVPVKPPGR